MQIEILLSTSRRSDELKYVTAHFQDLQGFRLAPLWVALLALSLVAPSHLLQLWQLATAALTIISLSFGWLIWSGRWYERRYGVVRSPESRVPSGIISILHPEPKPHQGRDYGGVRAVNLLLMALYMVPELFSRLDGRFGDFGLMVVIFAVLPRCLYPASANTLIRLRRILSIAASIFICAVYLSYLFARVGKWPYLADVCVILLLLDLYDHWLFTRLLSGGSAAVDE